jgi:signal transduction histidine kinase
MAPPRFSTGRVLAASATAALGLVIVGWLDYTATRQELLRLLREQAVSLRQTIAAAARANEAAGTQAEAQVTERLLDNARLLADLDRRGGLTQEYLDAVASRNRLFRVAVFAADGSREKASSGPGREGQGRGFPGASILQRILIGTETEIVEQMHSTRWGSGARIAAGVRRAKGGAILLNVDATEIEALQRQTSLDNLVGDITTSAAQIAYVVLEGGGVRIAHGDLPPAFPNDLTGDVPQGDGRTANAAEHDLMVNGRPVLEFAASVTLGSRGAGILRLGLRLDDLQRAERRVLTRLIMSLAAALALSLLALGTVWLRQAYSTLSEKHAHAEAALRRRDRLSAMGELASTVAHEVRNPLNAIAMSGQRLRREFMEATATAPEHDRAELGQLLGIVEGETRRINDIVQQFLEFARPPTLAPMETDLAAHVNGAVEAMRPLASSRGVALVADVTGARRALVDPDQLRQAVDNLLRNALEATPAGGQVRVEVRSTGKGHSIEVRDTGAGIDPDALSRIFDLYFTTKPQGTGIGLAVSQQIVTAHEGTIEVESKLGAGTRMTIRLPRAPGEATDG